MSVVAIAERAGVSIATVSRVLNNNPRVNPETARLIRHIAGELNYDAGKIRRGPRLGKRAEKSVQRLGIISVGLPTDSWLRYPVYTDVITSITKRAGALRARVVIDGAIDSLSSCAALRDRAIDCAILFVHSTAQPQLVAEIARALPVVRVMGELMAFPEIDQVGPDNMSIGRVAYQYLKECNCRHLAYFTSRAEHSVFHTRGMGFLMEAARSGDTMPSVYTTGADAPPFLKTFKHYESLDDVADNLAALVKAQGSSGKGSGKNGSSSTGGCSIGLFTSMDREAIGLYPVLERRGLQPGRDVRIIGCNNEYNLAMLNPRPATIDIGAEEMAKWAVLRLTQRSSRAIEPPVRVQIMPKLVRP